MKAKIFIISGTLIAFLYIMMSWPFIQAQMDPNSDLIKEAPSTLSTSVNQSTVDLLNGQGIFFGRAYFGNGHLITARHVIEGICNGFPCKDSFVKVLTSTRPTIVTLGENLMCREWLDLCLIVTDEEVFQKFLEQRSSTQKTQEGFNDIFVKDIDRDLLKQGQFEKKHLLGPEIKMKLKMGYSGSPIFNRDGSPVAILSRAGESNVSLLPIFLLGNALGFDKKLTFTVGNAIDFDAVDLVYDCYERRSCSFEKESNLLAKNFSEVSLAEFSLLDLAMVQLTNQLFWGAWNSKIPQSKGRHGLDFEEFKIEYQKIAQRSGKEIDDSNLNKIWILYALSIILDEESVQESTKKSTLDELSKIRTIVSDPGLLKNVDFILKKYE